MSLDIYPPDNVTGNSSQTFEVAPATTATQAFQWGQTRQLGYVSVTANQTGITTITDVTSLTLTFTPLTGQKIKLTAYLPYVTDTVAGDSLCATINEGATVLGQSIQQSSVVGNCFIVIVYLTPTAASHTYKVQLGRFTGTGTLTMNAGATFPAWFEAEIV
jgi:hypothetical protein